MKVTLKRDYKRDCTIGKFEAIKDGKRLFYCVTLELPNRGNAKGISCIPEGIYTVSRLESSNAFKYAHYHVQGVPNREGIKIHVGNYTRQIEGCILPGDTITDIDGDGTLDVTDSRATLTRMLRLLPDKFELEITGI